MINRSNNILQNFGMKNKSFFGRVTLLCLALLMLSSSPLLSQVITNEGAAITVKIGTVVGSQDAINNTGGVISNDGEINLAGNYTSIATTSGNGFFRIGGNWTNTGGVFIPGSSTVVFNGADDQFITKTGGETFHNLSVMNTGAPSFKVVGIANNVTVLGTLSMSVGNIDAGTYVLYLSNQLAASLNYTSTTGSRIFGKFERGINEAATYLFPLGTSSYYNPANLTTHSVISSGSVLSQFITSPPPGNTGLPIPDPPVEIATAFPDGFWSFTSHSSFSTSDFNINLDATGFADTIRDVTRVIKRNAGGNWTVDGTHEDAVGSVVKRDNLTGDISTLGTDFALGRTRPLITSQPESQTVCENTNPTFSVTATGAEPLTYRWYHDGVIITNGPHYSGARTSTLKIIGAILSDVGTYYCIVSDRYRDTTQSNSATLVVMKIPKANVSPEAQNHECSDIDFDNIIMDMTYHDNPGGTFVWTRDNPGGIISAIPLSGTAYNLGDALSGAFTNSSDAPLTITFTITPIGPAPTFCVGLPVEAVVTVNPTPRVLINNTKQICYGNSTQIVLSSPTTMTQGVIQYDYTITATATAPDLVGNTTPANDLPRNHTISWPYQNNTDTMQSVFYHITPKNVISGCNNGTIVIPEIKVHPKPLQDLFPSVPFVCEGGSDAILTAILAKTAKPDRVTWHRPWVGDTTYTTYNDYENLNIHTEGSYWVIVQDSLGCNNTSAELQMAGPNFNSSLYVKDTDTGYGTSCPDSTDGEIWIWEENTSAAVPPYAFWLIYNATDTVAADTLFAKGFANHKEIKNLPSGHYMLIIRDGNGCINLSYPEADIIEPDTIAITFDMKQYIPGGYNISCMNYTDGKVWVNNIGGGNGDYSFKWSTLDGLITGPDTLNVIDSVSAGKYYLVTTDKHFCTRHDSITLTQPDGISVVSYKVSFSPDSAYNIACTGDQTGFVELDITGGSGDYIYSWTGPGTFSATTKDIHNLIAGTYIATIRDQANVNCILAPQPTFDITEPAPLGISAIPSVSANGPYNINCHGSNTGTIDITVTGGSVGNYQYNWSTVNGSGIVQGQEDQWTLTAGTYHLLVTDKNGCSKTIDVTLTEPAALGSSLVPKHITCFPAGFNNGSINLTVNGGVGPYSFIWSNGETTEDISDLTEGYYKVTITDANGCPYVDSVRINLPPPLEYTKILSDHNGYNISCNGLSNGSVDITPASGLPPYIFNWERIGEGTIATTENISGLKAGQYRFTITDANQCTTTEDIELTEPGKFSMTFDLSTSTSGGYNINCSGTNTGTIDVNPVNEVGNVSYLWSDGSALRSRTNMHAGEYGLIITDSNNCQADSSVTLTEPDPIELTLHVTRPWCPDKPDGEISLTVTGGVPGADYTYKWSDNSTGRNITNIPSGLYKVTVSDLNGCSVRDSVFVEPQRETCLIIPNAISPNGDLINDVWNIGLIELYPQMEIKIFNRWGEIIWRSEKGYPHPWDGRSNGILLPVDSYHYIIDLHKGSKPILGNVTIVR
jgi:gliding motility-associated-like protein